MKFEFFDVTNIDEVEHVHSAREVHDPEAFIKVLNACGIVHDGKVYRTKNITYHTETGGFVCVDVVMVSGSDFA